MSCPSCETVAAVRRNNGGKLYYDCPECGRINPLNPGGQNRILERATIWGEQGTPPPECPKWIAGNWSFSRRRDNPAAFNPIGGQVAEASKSAPKETPEPPPKAPRRITPPPPAPTPKEPPENTPEETTEPAEPKGFDFLD